MTWDCGECGITLRDAETRCPACDVREIESLRARAEALAEALEEIGHGSTAPWRIANEALAAYRKGLP